MRVMAQVAMVMALDKCIGWATPPPRPRRTGSPCRGHRRRYSVLSYI